MIVAMAKRGRRNGPYRGDDCDHWRQGLKTTLCIVDGIGHGEPAHIAAKAALDYVAGHLGEPLTDVFAGCNSDVSDTRGVAMGIAVIDQNIGLLTYASIGNSRAMIWGENAIRLRSDYGIVGGGYRTLTPQTVPFGLKDTVVMFTDGILDTVNLTANEDAIGVDMQRLPERIIQDWSVDRDDVAVLVSRSEVG